MVDAAGGSEKFADSATSMLADIFGPQSIRLLPAQSPVLRLPGFEIESARYRRAAKVRLSNAKGVRLWTIQVNDRPAIFLAREDLAAGLTGYSSFTCAGYDPSTAFDLVRNITFTALNCAPPAPKK